MSSANIAENSKPVALIGALDTKGEEIKYLRDRLARAGVATLVIDVGVLGEPDIKADVERAEVIQLGGTVLEELLRECDRGHAIATMQAGMTEWMKRHGREQISGALAIGGSAGTAIASAGMRELPIGMPKLLVSTVASGDVRPYIGTSDITLMYSVGDFTGLNRLTRAILRNAADAMAGMCSGVHERYAETDAPLIGATMFGVTTPCVNQVRQLLEQKGYELLVFHATGTGGAALERLVQDGFIKGVADITTTELADQLVGGVWPAGPTRLEVAGEAGIPQVVSVGALDMVNFGPLDTVPARFKNRLFYQHNSGVTLMRTTPEENEELGRMIARKLNRARGPVRLLLPLKGVSALDCEGKPFRDAAADEQLFRAIRKNIDHKVELIELDLHINDLAFAQRFVAELVAVMSASASPRHPAPGPQENHHAS